MKVIEAALSDQSDTRFWKQTKSTSVHVQQTFSAQLNIFMNRIFAVFASALLIQLVLLSGCSGQPLQIMTVDGFIPAEEMGRTLPHEHILVDFGGGAMAGPHRYDAEDAYRFIFPHLQDVKKAGYATFIECTPAYLGRDAQLFRRLSRATGLNLLTNTGYYGARRDLSVPAHAFEESAQQIAQRWIEEWRNGIDGTTVRPGFIKTAFDRGSVSKIDVKLFEAAAITHLATGLTIATHTVDNLAAVETQLETLKQTGVSPSAWIWVHANRVGSFDGLLPALKAGAWISLDGVRDSTFQIHLDLILEAKRQGYLSQILVSHDAGWYRVGEPKGSPERFRNYLHVTEKLIPTLLEQGLTPEDIHQLETINPQQAFAVRIRKSE